jgi:CheY-like chemotaxis protein
MRILHADLTSGRSSSDFDPFRCNQGLAQPLLFQWCVMAQNASARILIVDDEPEIRAFVSDALDTFGYQVTAVADAQQAFAAAATTRFDLVLSDLRLPGLRGWDFVARLRSIDPTLSVIMLTGSAPEDDDLRRVREAGVPVLHKPVQLLQLQTALSQALRGRAA